MSDITLLVLATILMLPGLVGVVLPVLPGLVYMWFVALGFGFIDKFVHLTPGNLVILFILTLISLIIDYSSGTLGAKLGGASAKASAAGLIGFIAGMALLPPFGGFLGMFLAVFYVEVQTGTVKHALKAAQSSLLGSLIGIAINVVLALLFIGLFVGFALR